MSNKPNEITDNAPTWWEIQNIPTEMVRELRRRNNTNNVGMSIPTPLTDVTFNFEKTHGQYRGPMTPWIRVFSNGTGQISNGFVPRSGYLNKQGYQDPDTKGYDGFILKGGDGFYDAFGYNQTNPLTQKGAIIGYQANGEPHFLDPSLRSLTNYQAKIENGFPQDNVVSSILPPPGIVSAQLRQSRELLTFASFKFNCYSLAQLEYMMPFFLTPGLNVIIEFGWNLFNQKSLLTLREDDCWDIISNPQTALDRANLSYGNYGCVTGIITKYNFTTQNGFIYECNIECTSRQGLFAGFRADNNATKNNGGLNSNEYINLKNFIKIYLPSINEVLKSRSNFVDYVVANKREIANKYAEKTKNEADAEANQEQTEKRKTDAILEARRAAAKPSQTGKSSFYKGKAEDRVFVGRREDIYRLGKDPKNSTITQGRNNVRVPPIPYGDVGVNTKLRQVSWADIKTDFDAKDTNDEAWLQLDFVFEIINLFCSNPRNNLYVIDNTDIIINAHPNLISCDKNVLIPNPVAPKVNIGRPLLKDLPNKGIGAGYLEGEQADPTKNIFLDQSQNVPDITLFQSNVTEQDRKNKNIDADKSLILAALAAAKTFKTLGLYRDDLDRVINWFYYNGPNKWPEQSAAFPFAQDKIANGASSNSTKKYKKYYYGYLKNLMISKSRLLEISNDENVKTLKDFVLAILTTINSAVDDFWKFDIVDGTNGKLSIVDKNTINMDSMKKIYMFDLAKTNNVVKSINFDVSLTNEQANNVLFAGANSPSLTEKIQEQIANATNQSQLNAIITQTTKTPFIKFRDRLDVYQLKQLADLKGEDLAKAQQAGNVPGINTEFIDENKDIANIQIYGDVIRNDILCMHFLNLRAEDYVTKTTRDRRGGSITTTEIKDIETIKNPAQNWKYLCLPPNMKAKLRRMLDDEDISGNISQYSAVADNFQISMVLDGLYGFRNLQVFAISNLPKPYVPGNVIFQILEVEHNISSGKWETNITALLRCIAGSNLEYINI